MPITTAGVLFMIADMIGEAITEFTNANAYLGVGDSTTAFATSQQDLQATTNKTRKAMAATYPSRSGMVVTFRSTFTTTDANYAWNEWGVFNGSGAGGAGPSGVVMLNRKVESPSLGTKTSSEAWQLTVALTFAAA